MYKKNKNDILKYLVTHSEIIKILLLVWRLAETRIPGIKHYKEFMKNKLTVISRRNYLFDTACTWSSLIRWRKKNNNKKTVTKTISQCWKGRILDLCCFSENMRREWIVQNRRKAKLRWQIARARLGMRKPRTCKSFVLKRKCANFFITNRRTTFLPASSHLIFIVCVETFNDFFLDNFLKPKLIPQQL